MPDTQMGLIKQDGRGRKNAATDRVQRETYLAVAKDRRKRERAAKAKRGSANARATDNVPGAGESIVRETVAARSRQEGSVVVIEDSVEPNSETTAGETPADVKLVKMTDDVGSQLSTEGKGAHQEKEDDVAKVLPCLGDLWLATVADAATVAASKQAGDDFMMKVKEMMEKLKT